MLDSNPSNKMGFKVEIVKKRSQMVLSSSGRKIKVIGTTKKFVTCVPNCSKYWAATGYLSNRSFLKAHPQTSQYYPEGKKAVPFELELPRLNQVHL
jgi:hypothetical protein